MLFLPALTVNVASHLLLLMFAVDDCRTSGFPFGILPRPCRDTLVMLVSGCFMLAENGR